MKRAWHPHERMYTHVEPVPTSYSDCRDPDLPWGYWMRLVEGYRDGVEDEEGRFWPSLRLALWSSRLQMDDPGRRIEELLDNLQGALAIAGRRGWQSEDEVAGQIDGGLHYRMWMRGQNLTTNSGIDRATGRTEELDRDYLTDEGWAVYLMLKMTRAEELSGLLPGSDAFETAGGADMADIANPVVNIAGARYVFERSSIAGQQVVTLLDRNAKSGRMPIARTIWSIGFDRAIDRDRLFAWLCARSDQWSRWGALAGNGGDRLSQHVLANYIASVDWRKPQLEPLAITDKRHAA